MSDRPAMPRPVLASGERVGVYGGSFDPIHEGHIHPVLAALKAAELTRVLYLPTAYPPHKKDVQQAAADLRLQMVELALEEHSRLQVLDDEIVAKSAYTVDTLTRLSEEYPENVFVLLMGSDSYQNLTQWHRWQDIVAGWDVVVLPRPGWPVERRNGPGQGRLDLDRTDSESQDMAPDTVLDEVQEVLHEHSNRTHIVLEEPLLAVSSTEIRQLLESDQPVPVEWVPAPVLNFLEERHVYRTLPEHAQPIDDLETLPETVTISNVAESHDVPSSRKPDAISSLPAEVALAARTALDRQAIDLRLLEMGAVCDFADYFLICSGNSDRQVGAIAHAIQRALRKAGEKPLHIEGERRGTWVLVDYGHLIVHVFDPPTRDFYRLERLWSDAPRVPHQLFGLSQRKGASPDQQAHGE